MHGADRCIPNLSAAVIELRLLAILAGIMVYFSIEAPIAISVMVWMKWLTIVIVLIKRNSGLGPIVLSKKELIVQWTQ